MRWSRRTRRLCRAEKLSLVWCNPKRVSERRALGAPGRRSFAGCLLGAKPRPRVVPFGFATRAKCRTLRNRHFPSLIRQEPGKEAPSTYDLPLTPAAEITHAQRPAAAARSLPLQHGAWRDTRRGIVGSCSGDCVFRFWRGWLRPCLSNALDFVAML